MKKIYKLVLTFILCFIFSNKVNASEYALYTNENIKSADQPRVIFMVIYDSDRIYIRPLNTFTYMGETKGSNDMWSSIYTLGTQMLSGDIIYISSENGNDIKNSSYLYYDITKGKNKFYLSDSNNIKPEYDMAFEKLPQYKESDSGSILESMMCTYGLKPGQQSETGNKFVSVRFFKEDNRIKYQILFNFVEFYDRFPTFSESYTGSDGAVYITDESIMDFHLDKPVKKEVTYSLDDHITPKLFFSESLQSYSCPEYIVVQTKDSIYTSSTDVRYGTTIKLGWEKEFEYEFAGSGAGRDENGNRVSISHSHTYSDKMMLYEDSSYVIATPGISNSSQFCLFDNKADNSTEWKFGLTEDTTIDNNRQFTVYGNYGLPIDKDITFDLTSGIIDSDCTQLSEIYTDCFTTRYSKCKISQVPFEVYDEKGNLLDVKVEKYYLNKNVTSYDKDKLEKEIGFINGIRYKNYLCELKPKLTKLIKYMDNIDFNEIYAGNSRLSKTSNLAIYKYNTNNTGVEYYNILDLPCDSWGIVSDNKYNTQADKNELKNEVNSQIKDIMYYCKDVYETIENNPNDSYKYESRYNECRYFELFYGSLVEQEVVGDLLLGCEYVSNDLKDKLLWILDIMKIAAPILAIVLGMLDFVKVVTGGDPDKEMKSAWKRLQTRLIAAVLLFLVPILLSMLINIFIGEEISNNPYCGLFEKKETYLPENEK